MAATGRIMPEGAFVFVPAEDFWDSVRAGTTEPSAYSEALDFSKNRRIRIDRRGACEMIKIFYDLDLREIARVVYGYKVVYPSVERLEMDYPLKVF